MADKTLRRKKIDKKIGDSAVGAGDLSIATTTALANLFNALNRPELDNVLVVILT